MRASEQLRRLGVRRTPLDCVLSMLRYFIMGSIILMLLQRLLSGTCLLPPTGHAAGKETFLVGKKVLLLTAHPDDETMFFAPLLSRLARSQVNALILSTGDADGMGSFRKKEAQEAYANWGVPARRVDVLNDPLLQDGMQTEWEEGYVSSLLRMRIAALGIDAVITFDGSGVSGHSNHRTCFRAAQALQDEVQVWTLQSHALAGKYLSLLKAVWGMSMCRSRAVLGLYKRKEVCILASPTGYRLALRAMRSHASQLVWFRYFYLVLSEYMYLNVLVQQ